MFGEISWLMSVVMEKCVAAYQVASTASRSDSPITGHAFFAHRPMARTTKAVIDFMREWVNGIRQRDEGMNGAAFEAIRQRQNGGGQGFSLGFSIGLSPGLGLVGALRCPDLG